MQRIVIASLIVVAFSAWSGVAQARPSGAPSSQERAAIVKAARPYIAQNSVKGLEVTIKAVTLSSPRGFATVIIDSSAGGASVLLRKLTNGPWWPVDLGSEFSCSEATAALFASMHYGCLQDGKESAPILPDTARWSRACGKVASRYNPDHFRVYVTFGTLSCAAARRIVPQGIDIQHGWTYWDWTKGKHRLWSDVFQRDDGGAVVTAIWVKG